MKTVDEQITEDENITGVFFSTYERAFIRRIGEAVYRNTWQSATKAQMERDAHECGDVDHLKQLPFPGDPT